MKCITTKYLRPTNTRGSRISATDGDTRIIVPYDHAARDPHEVAATYTVRCLGGVAWTENLPDLMAAAREWMVSREAGLTETRIIDDTTGLDVTEEALRDLDEHERDFGPDDEDEDPPCDACGRPPHGWPRCRCASDVDMQIADHEDGS